MKILIVICILLSATSGCMLEKAIKDGELVIDGDLFSPPPSVRDLNKYMKNLSTDLHAPLPESIFKDPTNGLTHLKVIEPYFLSEKDQIRYRAYNITYRIGENNKDIKVRRMAVNSLIKGISDKDGGISGSASESLMRFYKNDFTDENKKSILECISKRVHHLDRVIKIAGYLEIEEAKTDFYNIINSTATERYKWAARLSLARMNDSDSINYVFNKSEELSVNDNYVYTIVPQLIYTRQKKIYRKLEKIIHSDSEDCGSSDPDSRKTVLCGYRVIGYIAPTIKYFPIKTDEFGDLIVTDYKAALSSVRMWLKENPDYEILKNAF